ncbi:hypothetical protein [Mesorhizobium sp. GbtcB19]|uniref:hypothetical protein n=1 Tax=Mesorhizobium sp. GbtcB19 TaxID=2824764 RepID=UPI001C2F8414|nr:hypothetical protein [Mesorhizobium sp. GbtcB19]
MAAANPSRINPRQRRMIFEQNAETTFGSPKNTTHTSWGDDACNRIEKGAGNASLSVACLDLHRA